MDYRILGPFEIVGDEGSIDIAAPTQREILACLVLNANRVVSTDQLLENIWGEERPKSGLKTLRYHISKLRDSIQPDRRPKQKCLIVTQPPGYLLETEPDLIDAVRFEHHLDRARSIAESDPASGIEELDSALRLWRGPALAGFHDKEWAHLEAGRLEELRVAAVEDRLAAAMALGRHAALIAELEKHSHQHPLRERSWALWMTALYRSDRQAEALRVYQQLRSNLGEELGIEPSQDLQNLEERILLQDPTLRPMIQTPHNLPASLTSFVGRNLELIEIQELLGNARLVTLIGPGGSGKTRLGLQLAREALGAFPDGVWLIDLAPLQHGDLVAGAVAAVLGVMEKSDRSIVAGLRAHLRRWRMLLVLDNCDHLVESVARLAHELLEGAEGLRILATSREVLGVPGEVVFEVGGLTVPPTDAGARLEAFDSVRLFVDRAQAARAGFRINDRNAPLVVEVCRRLDGMPLALELAAAAVRTIGLEQLSRNLEDRLPHLTGGPRTVAPRHQTLQAAIDWSYEVLTDVEREAFNRLSVFAGSFTPEAAEYVCGGGESEVGEVFGVVSRLVDKSLIASFDDPSGCLRYRMLETIRLYAQERLRETASAGEAERRHAKFYRDLVVGAADDIRDGKRAWMERLEIEHGDLRQVLSWAEESDEVELALDLAGALFGFWLHRWHLAEAREWYARLRRMVGSATSLGRGRVLEGYGAFASEGEESAAAFEQAATVYGDLGDEQSRWRVLQNLGHRLVELGETTRARAIFEESVATMQAVGITHGCTLQALAHLVYEEGKVEEARRLFEEGLELGLRSSDAPCQSANLQWMAALERFEGNPTRARTLLTDALDAARRLGMFAEECAVKAELAMVERDEGNLEAARELLEQSLGQACEAGELLEEAEFVVWLGRRYASLEAAGGRAERAVRLYAGVHTHARASFEAWYDFERYASERYLDMCRAVLAAEVYARVWEQGSAMTVAELRDCMAEPTPETADAY